MNNKNPIPNDQKQGHSPGVLDLLLEQYENSEDENSFLDNLLFHQIYQELRMLDPDICDCVLTLTCALCGEYGRSGYIAGLKHGAHLMAELTI